MSPSRKTILITAGPTREWIDPVRFLSNESSGVVGYELAKEAERLGHRVILISGPVSLPLITDIETIRIESARDLLKVLKDKIVQADILFMAAAVADFRPVQSSSRKIKRSGHLTIKLKSNPDILKTLAHPRIKRGKIYVGFCIETEHVVKNAQRKLKEKNLDFMVASSIKSKPFGEAKFSPVVLNQTGKPLVLKAESKQQFARTMFRFLKQKGHL